MFLSSSNKVLPFSKVMYTLLCFYIAITESSPSTVLVATISCSLTFILTLTITAIITFTVTYKCMKQKFVVTRNEIRPTQNVYYEKIDPLLSIKQQPHVYDTCVNCEKTAKDLKKTTDDNGYELMASLRAHKGLNNATVSQCEEKTDEVISDHYIMMKGRPAYQNIASDKSVTNDKRKETQLPCNVSQS